MSSRRSVTQAEVARAARVSTATVSRVLNGSGTVHPTTRARIEAAIAALDYVPHEAARALARQRTQVLGAIVPTMNNAIFAAGINGFERAADARGYTFVLALSRYDHAQEQRLVRKMIERGVEGLLLVGNERLPETYAALRAAGVRHVCAWTHAATAEAANIGFSNGAAMAPLVDHLVALGHRRFAMLAAVTSGNDRARERVEGVRRRLARHGLSLPAERLMELPYSVRRGRERFRQLWAERPTAVLCGNDIIALGALFEAQAMGLRIPDDLSITGFDDLPLAAEVTPPLTTVDVPAEAMGAAAATALIDAVEADGVVAGRRLETTLVVRGTTGAAP